MASAGYSGTPLVKKLGIKPGFKVLLIGAPDHYLVETLGPLPADVALLEVAIDGEMDFVQYFTKSSAELESAFPRLKAMLKPNATLWVSWPKKASKVPTDLDGNVVRRLGLEGGLVDVKVCAVDEVWSGLKFVYRLKDR